MSNNRRSPGHTVLSCLEVTIRGGRNARPRDLGARPGEHKRPAGTQYQRRRAARSSLKLLQCPQNKRAYATSGVGIDALIKLVVDAVQIHVELYVKVPMLIEGDRLGATRVVVRLALHPEMVVVICNQFGRLLAGKMVAERANLYGFNVRIRAGLFALLADEHLKIHLVRHS